MFNYFKSKKNTRLKHIVSIANDGLSGRLICLLNTLLIAEKFKCRASLVWGKNSACQADFETLFDRNAFFDVESHVKKLQIDDQKIYVLSNMYRGQFDNINSYMEKFPTIAKKSGFKRKALLENGKYDAFIKNHRVTDKDFDQELISNEVVFLRSRNNISSLYRVNYGDIFNRYLIPKKNIQYLADKFAQENMSKNTLGVHVRRGDLVGSTIHMNRLIPLEKYFYIIDKLLLARNFDNIFIATETTDIIYEFNSRYGGKVISYPTVEHDRSESGVYNALIDFLLLRKCSLIVAGESGVPDFVSRINNVKYIELKR